MRVLIAEDTPLLQEMISEFMDCWGYEFDLASNGLEAVNLAKAREGQYDICLMDIDMPVMDGCEATREIRKQLKYFPIMALSGNERIGQIYPEIGIDDFIKKPYSMDTLFDKIDELTVKVGKIYIENDTLLLKKETPMDAQHLNELRELRKKGLTKLCIHGSGHEFIVDERVQNKISHDLIGKKQELSEFLDRSDEKPGICHLYKANFLVNTRYLLPDEFEELDKREKELLKDCNEKIVKPSDD